MKLIYVSVVTAGRVLADVIAALVAVSFVSAALGAAPGATAPARTRATAMK